MCEELPAAPGYIGGEMRGRGKFDDQKWVVRHSYNVRICHWINVISFGFLLTSGVHVFLDFPELYWGDVGYRGHETIFRLSDWGLSWDEAGALGDRRWGRNYHFLFAWVFLFNGLIYLLWNICNRHFGKNIVPACSELKFDHLMQDVKHHLSFRPPQGAGARGYNTLQKISYCIVIFTLMPLIFATGLAQMPAFMAIAPELIDLMGGRQSARTMHVICMLLLVLFVLVHILEVFVAGVVNEIRSMITGRYALPKDNQQ